MKKTPRWLGAALLASALPVHAGLLFSEYVEGSSNNKALEIYNPDSSPVDLAAGNYRIAEYFNGGTSASSTITLSGTIAPGGVYVLVNPSASAALLSLANATSGSLTFNGNDAVALLQGSTPIDVIGQIGNDPGSNGWGSGATTTTDHSLRRLANITSGDPVGSDAFDPTQQWVGFARDTFDGLGCPGVSACGTQPSNDHRIYEIQGRSHISPLNGQLVTNVPGIVTALASNGFYMQDGDGDGDSATSDGIFVFTSSAPTVSVGSEVRVNGTVSEFRPGGSGGTNNLTTTEIASPTVTPATNLFTHNTIAPTIIGNGGRVPPNEIIDNDTHGSVEVAAQTTYDPDQDGIDFYESLEGMLVQVNSARAISATNKFGEIWVLGDAGANATGVNAHGGVTLIDHGDGTFDYNPERILVDVSGLTTTYPQVQVGDTTAQVVGVMSYGFSDYRIYPLTLPSFTAGNLQAQTATLPFGADRLTIASYNVENLDANDNDVCDGGPDQDVANGRFAHLASHIAGNLGAPAIVGLEEIQDNDGCTDDGVVDGSQTLNTLVQAIRDAGGPSYQYVEVNPSNDTDGGIPGGNIRQAILYDASRVSFVPGSLGAGDAVTATALNLDGGKLQLNYSPGRIDPNNIAWSSSRKPLVATFDFNGRRIVVVANHFNSKGGDQPLFGRYQPPVLSSAVQRQQQTQLVHDFVAQALGLDPRARVVVLGDMNDFSFSTPLQVLSGQAQGAPILTDLSDALLPAEERYSYVYEGNAQELDHIYVTNSLLPHAAYQPVHVNAEFSDQASDHDPLLASLQLNLNQAPTASAVAPASVLGGQTVVLDGSASADADGQIVSYLWTQTGGPAVDLSNATAASASFTAPAQAVTLGFTLTVTDNDGATDSRSVSITVVPPNQPPLADAGSDQSVQAASSVQLSAAASHDADGQIVSYQWTQTAGPAVSLSAATSATPSFTAPSYPTLLSFTVTVTDNSGATASASVNITVLPDAPPVADAGADQSVTRFALVQLNGSASHDSDGQIVSYQWTQTGGPTVSLSGANTATPSFRALAKVGTTMSFTLTVTDNAGVQGFDTVVVTIKPFRSGVAATLNGWYDEVDAALTH